MDMAWIEQVLDPGRFTWKRQRSTWTGRQPRM